MHALTTRSRHRVLARREHLDEIHLRDDPEDETLVKSFRNLKRTLVLEPSELEVGAIVWARSVLATEGALARVTEVNAK